MEGPYSEDVVNSIWELSISLQPAAPERLQPDQPEARLHPLRHRRRRGRPHAPGRRLRGSASLDVRLVHPRARGRKPVVLGPSLGPVRVPPVQ